ncbi:hypothetical protein GWI33_020331 [Rhynchophorus ferrugineus]|uniref:Reticulocalbin-3 n=1 Tax=Rhynchophorus ferrugineus TaxID=354439 RepID=A0A834HR99_RHYFE|nr:hypothetical protein GWI33_020331 [Rhynchophorus ferrugineus]
MISPINIQYSIIARTGVVHTGHNHDHNAHKEREIDGAYAPRDHDHYDDTGIHRSDFDHEAILGSYKEAEEYDHLPPEEAKRRLSILLTKMDISKDGYIDRKELKAWIIRSFKTLSEEEANEKLEDADEDNDGKVSWAEYIADTYGTESAEDNTLKFHEENIHLISDDKEMWKAADKNKDGVLDSQEWIAFSNPEEHPDMIPIILQQTLRNRDNDNDGSINFQEFVGDRGSDLDKEALHAEKVKFDEEYDKDKDGKLTGNEILSWMIPSDDEIADEEVIHLFAHSDDDHDDLLSFQEILDHHETFVGSEATDYGDHLHNIHQFTDEL